MKWPTTLILLSVIATVALLGYDGTLDGSAVTSILGTVVGAVSVGHYVKTINGSVGQAPSGPAGSTTTTTVDRPPADEGP